MFSKLKTALALSLLVVGWARPAAAAMDVDNSEGRYNGHHKCTITVHRPGKDPEEVEGSVDLADRWITIHLKDQDLRTRYDHIVDYSYKTEIDAHDPNDKKVRYRLKIEGNIVP